MGCESFFNKVNSCKIQDMNSSEFFEKIKPEVAQNPSLPQNGSLVKAAVLVTALLDDDEMSFGLIRRAASLSVHANQISFPGGHMETGETPAETALRETEEEIGIFKNEVEVVGYMEPVATFTTGYLVWPVVGILRQSPKIKLDPKEVAEFFWVPVRLFTDGRNYAYRSEILMGEKKPRRAIMYNSYEIWGVTLRIIESLVGPDL